MATSIIVFIFFFFAIFALFLVPFFLLLYLLRKFFLRKLLNRVVQSTMKDQNFYGNDVFRSKINEKYIDADYKKEDEKEL